MENLTPVNGSVSAGRLHISHQAHDQLAQMNLKQPRPNNQEMTRQYRHSEDSCEHDQKATHTQVDIRLSLRKLLTKKRHTEIKKHHLALGQK